ncbi:hypothetical protein KY347_01020 [Candidatus Woesearchaeota archaeon]|nr:hypothetical protein [Candidatus Woesearchaeota archaeon]
MPEILSETPVNTQQLKEELDRIKKRDDELNLRAAKTEEHLEHIGTNKNAGALFDKINKLNISRLKEQHINKIIDIMPATVKDLKVVMQGYTISLSNENMKKIVDLVNEHIGK